jgi:hypothetical protein
VSLEPAEESKHVDSGIHGGIIVISESQTWRVGIPNRGEGSMEKGGGSYSQIPVFPPAPFSFRRFETKPR